MNIPRECIKEILAQTDYVAADDKLLTQWMKEESSAILASIGDKEADRLFAYKFCEVDRQCLAFLENYKDISETLPVDFTVIDIGCYMAFQADYFKNFVCYIGVEPAIPIEYRLRQANAEYYKQTAQSFVAETLPKLIANGLDMNKTFAICSGVPDDEANKLIAETFRYFRIAYPGQEDIESFLET